MYVCARALVCVYIHVCAYVYACASAYLWVYVCMCVHICVHVYARTCMHMCVHICVSVHVCEECPPSMSTRVSVELTTDLCKVKTLCFHSCWSQTEAEARKDTSFLFVISHEGVLLILVLS